LLKKQNIRTEKLADFRQTGERTELHMRNYTGNRWRKSRKFCEDIFERGIGNEIPL
jgi:hypothetical protein